MTGRIQVIVGGQYGSEAKGAVAGYLARPFGHGDLAIRVGGPNAGHSVAGVAGHIWPLRQVPVAAVTNHTCSLAIAAGSEVDFHVLGQEVTQLQDAGYLVTHRLLVDPAATVLEHWHAKSEAEQHLTEVIGSTGKGIGAARADRAMRQATTIRDAWPPDMPLVEPKPVADLARALLNAGGTVQIEGTQGWGLGLHGPHYPYATSGDCRAIDFMAQAGVSPWQDHVDTEVWVVVRPNPIRVAGNSGPLKDETTWEALGLPPELTTVTRKVRRVGGWDPELVWEALRANGAPSHRVHLALTMGDHLDPEIAGARNRGEIRPDSPIWDFIAQVETELGQLVELLGTSPRTIVDLRI